jgi:hypothetical protein
MNLATITIVIHAGWHTLALVLLGADLFAIGWWLAGGIGDGPDYSDREDLQGFGAVFVVIAAIACFVFAGMAAFG